MSRTTSGLTGESTPSISCTAPKPTSASRVSRHAEQRRRERAADLEPLAVAAREVADAEQDQRGAAQRLTSRQSISRPTPKPATAPVTLPPSSPSETTSAGRVGADVEELDLGEEGELQQHADDHDRGEAGEISG